MPRRLEPDPLARAIGQRIRQLREEIGLTLEKLAYESDLGSKGYLSDIERGLAQPSLTTLKILADRLEVDLVDFFTHPERSARHWLIDRTRKAHHDDEIVRVSEELGPPSTPSKVRGGRAR